MSDRPFYFVWNENGHAPTHKHLTEEAAVTEAQRLARQVRGQKFIVLESVTAFVCDDMQTIDLRPEFCDEIPF